VEKTTSPGAAQLVQPLAAFFQKRTPRLTNFAIRDAVEPSQGFSNKTVLFRLTWDENGKPQERQLVARIQRATDCPMLADVLKQWRVMEEIAANSDVAIPPLVLAEADPSILGMPFFLMERVEGRPTPDNPPHHASGWFKDELTPGLRGHAWWNAVTEMSRLHRIDWRCFGSLHKGSTRTPGADFYIEDFIKPWYEWGAQGRSFPVLEEAIRRLQNDRPPAEHAGLIWNDSRTGNTMFARDLTVAALVDFEVASLGPVEIDIAQWIYMEDVFSTLRGYDRLAGVPKREEAIQGFERIYGRPMLNLDYYDAIAALKHAVIFLRSYGNDKETGAVVGVHLDYATERISKYLSRSG
jgi:aminoglycoside phosphotransferase (APT) family kinase protein